MAAALTAAEQLRQRCQRKGLLIAAEESLLLMMPALNIERELAERGLDILESCL